MSVYHPGVVWEASGVCRHVIDPQAEPYNTQHPIWYYSYLMVRVGLLYFLLISHGRRPRQQRSWSVTMAAFHPLLFRVYLSGADEGCPGSAVGMWACCCCYAAFSVKFPPGEHVSQLSTLPGPFPVHTASCTASAWAGIQSLSERGGFFWAVFVCESLYAWRSVTFTPDFLLSND